MDMAMEFVAVKVAAQHASGWTGATKRIWLLLYAEGGRWTSAEISGRLRVGGSVYATLREMVEKQQLARVDDAGGIRYAVTRPCRVPQGVTVDEMWALLQGSGGGERGA